MSTVIVRVSELLDFFDSNLDARRHSSSIKGVIGEELLLALLCEYFRRNYCSAEVVSRVCTTGQKRGYQLDAWVRVEREGSVVHYQVEVKSWSAHGVGSGTAYLAHDADTRALSTYMSSTWGAYWNGSEFSNPGLNKVLVPMKPPEGATCVLPLACLWAPVHPQGLLKPLFEQLLERQPFSKVLVYSASSFLRSIGNQERELALQLPNFAERMSWLSRLFVFEGNA